MGCPNACQPDLEQRNTCKRGMDIMQPSLGLGLSAKRIGVSAFNPNTKLLMGFNGADGSQDFIDESLSRVSEPPTLGWRGSAQLDTSWAKFGASSLYLDGSGDDVSWVDSDDWDFGDGPFTVDCWIRPTSTVSGNRHIVGNVAGYSAGQRSSSGWGLYMYNGFPEFVYNNGAAWVAASSPSAVSLDTEYHLAADRDATKKIRLYIDGEMVASESSGGTIAAVNQYLMIGQGSASANADDFCGNIDELRILKGEAAWGSDSGFVPPTASYARP